MSHSGGDMVEKGISLVESNGKLVHYPGSTVTSEQSVHQPPEVCSGTWRTLSMPLMCIRAVDIAKYPKKTFVLLDDGRVEFFDVTVDGRSIPVYVNELPAGGSVYRFG